MNKLKRKARRKVVVIEKSDVELTSSAFDKIFSKMTKEEQDQNFCNSMCGMWIYPGGKRTILMGSDAMDRYLNFQKQMIEKYSN